MNFRTLKQFLSGRLVKRHFTRHFRRLAILEMLRGMPVGGDVPPALTQSLTEAAFQEPDALLAKLNSHANGLDEFEADAIRHRVGMRWIMRNPRRGGCTCGIATAIRSACC